MRKTIYLFLLLVLVPTLMFGRLKKDLKQPDFSTILNKPFQSNSLWGILDPSKLNMSHSISMSYTNFGGQGIVMNTYMNTINYQFNEKLMLTTNLGVMGSPYNSFPNSKYLNENHFFGGNVFIPPVGRLLCIQPSN